MWRLSHVDGGRLFYAGGGSCQNQKYDRDSTKNVGLFAIACTMYLVCGYQFMYDGGYFLSGVTTVAQMDDAAVAQVLSDSAAEGFDGGSVYSGASDFFFQVVFVATAMSIVSGAVAERMKLWAFLAFAVVMTGFIYPIEGGWTWGGKDVPGLGALTQRLCWIWHSSSGGAAAALAGVIILGPRKGSTVLLEQLMRYQALIYHSPP